MHDARMLVTLWPSFPHFHRYVNDARLSGIRLNSAMVSVADLDRELPLIPKDPKVPLYFDIKGRQLRITHVEYDHDFTDITLNHPVRVRLPTPILFKGGEDAALGLRLAEGDEYYGGEGMPVPKDRLFSKISLQGGPRFLLRPGESLYIRDPSLEVGGDQFTLAELQKIEKVKGAGFTRWFLSYVESARDVDEFLELVGRNAEVMLKIESRKGLEYVAREFVKRDNLTLVAAKGDLFVEVGSPHEILEAQKLIIAKDPEACAGSRMMLSVINREPKIVEGAIRWSIEPNDVPSNADFEQLAWLSEIGYRSFMLCDELCLKDELLSVATNALHAFLETYEV